MSRHGLAITLAWYQLRSRVIADLSFEPIPKVLIRVYDIATVCYGPEILRWEIERPTDRLEYYICCFSDRIACIHLVKIDMNGTVMGLCWIVGAIYRL